MKRLVLLSLLALAACNDEAPTVQGYVEGEYVRVSLPAAGRVVSVAVEKGAHVQAGQVLFALEDEAEQAAVAEARAKLEQARFQRDNLLTGRRVLEIRAMEAQKAQAEADLRLSGLQLRRQETLIRSENTTRESLDNAVATVDRNRARVAELTAQLGFAREGGRSAEISAAVAAVDAAAAALAQAEWRLGKRKAEAPKAALVEDVLFRPGEDVGPGQPVVSLLPPGNVLFRFFLGPQQIGRVAPGVTLKVACAGCAADLAATVSFVAREASYAPPIIYSRENKEKLVFLIEARPLAPSDSLRPGQPVSLTLPGGEPGK
jgi:HlyD family secretion protein